MKAIHRKATFLFLPFAFGFFMFFVFPFFSTIYYALINSTVNTQFVGMENFYNVLTNKYFLLALKNTFVFTLTAVPLLVFLAYIFSSSLLYFLNTKTWFIRLAFFIPIIFPSASLVLFWKVFFEDYIMLPVYLLFIWKNLGYHIILYLVNMTRIPGEYEEAAKLEGAGYIAYHYFVVFPLSLPITFFVVVMSIVQSFRIFKDVFVVHGVYPNERLYFIQNYINNKFMKLSYPDLSAGTIVFVMLLIILFAILFYIGKFMYRRVYH
ncbi:MAG: sugar transporter permease [Herbinix sp.]|jgi:multiple sugar transport system permease protein|nr:sugar transporter permease [Herbinix sp.]